MNVLHPVTNELIPMSDAVQAYERAQAANEDRHCFYREVQAWAQAIEDALRDTCPECNDTGLVEADFFDGDNHLSLFAPCSACRRPS